MCGFCGDGGGTGGKNEEEKRGEIELSVSLLIITSRRKKDSIMEAKTRSKSNLTQIQSKNRNFQH